MQKLIEIPSYQNIPISNDILFFDKPDYVYIPIPENAKLLIKQDTKVSIGTPLISTKTKIITSPISGIIPRITKMNTKDGLMDCLEIMNDFKEKKVIAPIIKKEKKSFPKEKLAKILKLEFKLNFDKKKHIILNCIDDEPYVLTENHYLFLHFEGYLELLDKLSKLFNINSITICVKSSRSENINKLMEYLGMYPNITLKIFPNLYLLSRTEFLLNFLSLKEEDTVIIKASTFYDIYNLIERNRQMTDQLLTITGLNIHNPSLIKVKIGSKLTDIIENLIDLKTSDSEFIINGLMSGYTINIKNFIITKDIDSIFVMPLKKKTKSEKCINCGACINICPVNINPIFLFNKTYYNKVKDKCIKCGLCSYICPSNIDFNKELEGD